jgi:hypothetical protein
MIHSSFAEKSATWRRRMADISSGSSSSKISKREESLAAHGKWHAWEEALQ